MNLPFFKKKTANILKKKKSNKSGHVKRKGGERAREKKNQKTNPNFPPFNS